VFSAAMAYIWSSNKQVDPFVIWMLSFGGFLITACSNILNQLIEYKTDGMMERTKDRPIAAGRMTKAEAITLAIITGASGLAFLYTINNISFILGFAAIGTYALLYTLLKKQTVLSIIPGSIAGALPVLIGCTAANEIIGIDAIILFSIQIIWQVPHTWSIAWLLDDDYSLVGIKMLPTSEKSDTAALLILFSSFLTIPTGLLLFIYGFASIYAAFFIAITGVGLSLLAYKLYQQQDNKAAVKVMLGSLFYCAFVMFVLIADKAFI
jgi:protoheme IX farnesyltransferase